MKRLILLVADSVVFWLALVLTLVARYPGDFAYQWTNHLVPFAVLFPVWIGALYINDLYDQRQWSRTTKLWPALWGAVFLASTLSIAFFYLLPLYGITPKTNLFVFIGLFGILVAGTRQILHTFLEQSFRQRVAIIGTSPQSRELVTHLQTHPQLGYHLHSLVDDMSGGAQTLRHLITQKLVDVIVVSPEAYQVPALTESLYETLEHHVSVRSLVSFYEEVMGRVPLGTINQLWFLENIAGGHRRGYEILKRVVDVAVAVVLGVPTLVALPFLALAIKLNSPGPVLYRQRRMGQSGKPFSILKLRTMIANDQHGGAEGGTGAVWSTSNDPRVTRIGAFLRKTRIDELPQLWNVLRGELSLVGPRTERPEFHDTLKKEIPFYEERYLVKPGLSGLSQIYFGYGSSVADAAQKLQYDLYYIKHRSIWLDLGILLKTINVILRGQDFKAHKN